VAVIGTPVDDQALTGGVVGLRGAEHVDRAGGLGRCAGAAECDAGLDPVHGVLADADLDPPPADVDERVVAGDRLGHPGEDEPDGHRVDVDPVAAELLGQRLRQADDTGLGRGVVRLAGVAEDPGGGGDVDDFAVVVYRVGLEVGLGRPQDPKRRLEVHVEDGVPLLVGHFLGHVVPGVAGVVDDDVQAAEALGSGRHETLGEAVAGHRTDGGHGVAAGGLDVAGGLLGGFGVQVVDHYRGALGGEPSHSSRVRSVSLRTGSGVNPSST
jgi:hypothetical protein